MPAQHMQPPGQHAAQERAAVTQLQQASATNTRCSSKGPRTVPAQHSGPFALLCACCPCRSGVAAALPPPCNCMFHLSCVPRLRAGVGATKQSSHAFQFLPWHCLTCFCRIPPPTINAGTAQSAKTCHVHRRALPRFERGSCLSAHASTGLRGGLESDIGVAFRLSRITRHGMTSGFEHHLSGASPAPAQPPCI